MSIALLPPARPLPLLLWLGLAAAFLLGSALVAQYGFGMRPCHLCIWQRWPYGLMIALAALGGLLRGHACLLKALLAAAVLLLVVEAGLAAYHSAVERHWISGPTECSGGMQPGISMDEIRAKILGAPLTRCDEPAWMIPGISMANANFAASVALIVIAIARRPRKLECIA